MGTFVRNELIVCTGAVQILHLNHTIDFYTIILQHLTIKILRKINTYALTRQCTCAYQRIRNVNFSENFAYLRTK